MTNVVSFRRDIDHYTRNTDHLRHYVDQASFYLARTKNISIDEARDFVISGLRSGGAFEFKDPTVKYLHRENFADRVVKETTMSRFLKDVAENDESMTPVFVSYCSPDVKESLLAVQTMDHIVNRGKLKKEKFAAQRAGDAVRAIFMDLGQGNKKIFANSLSGASQSAATCLHNKTSHPGLTTNCRITAGYGSANNEKFLEGNRHYYCVDTILNNLISISTITDLEKVEIAMKQFSLHYPSADEVMECIMYSKNLYFKSNRHMGPVLEFVQLMKPLERAAFVYVGDFYHLYKHNKELVEQFMHAMVQVPTEPAADPDAILKVVGGSVVALATQLCREFTAGFEPAELKAKDLREYGILGACAEHISETLVGIYPIIDAFWMSDNMPASVAFFPESLRRCVLGGDTDSTLFTVERWVERLFGRIGFTTEMCNTSDVMIFLADQTAQHLHAMMSGNLGVHRDRRFDTVMKNEYKYDIFMLMSMAKHYAALIASQEGNVKTEYELELKGANLITSTTPGDVAKDIRDTILWTMEQIAGEKDLRLSDIIDKIAQKEREILQTVKSGETEFFKFLNLKTPEAYKDPDPDRNAYWNHTFWNNTFGKKYGTVGEPPYLMMKINLNINNGTEFKDWLDTLEPTLQEDVIAELARVGKKLIKTAYVPLLVVQSVGIPEEYLLASDARKIIRDCCSPYYHFLEALGVYLTDKKNSKMVFDLY